ncbi:MAG: NmrA/HSCARG family protein [Chloroflexi bacterium]|nr:NmrA/HSCARG family protein [Chloroflexota bacterium]
MTAETGLKTILVIGVTGKQGGGLAHHLIASGRWRVRGMSRDIGSERARSLAATGIEMVQADMDDAVSLRAAMDGAYGVFSVQAQSRPDDPMDEVRQGAGVIDAAVDAGVGHIVYSSSCGAKEPDRGVSYWDAKRGVAEHLRRSGVAYTLLRPVSFMENYIGDIAAIERGVIGGMLTPEKTLQVISGHDIGNWAAAAFDRRDTFAGQEIDIAAESITMDGIAATLGRVVGHPVVYREAGPLESANALPSAIAMTRWYQDYGYDEDIAALVARWGVSMLTFEQWLRRIWLPRRSHRPD